MNPKNKQYSAILKSWNIIYPVFIYFVVTNLAMTVFAMFATFLGADYEEQYMALQTATVAVTIPFIASYYNKDRKEPTVFQEHMQNIFHTKTPFQKVFNGILMFLLGAMLGMVLNNLLSLTSLEEVSEGYQEVTGYFFAGGILFELLGACLLTPFLEEMLYRSVVYGRLCDMMILDNEEKTEKGKKRERNSRIIAMVFSAVLFGVLHMNLVQFIYAGVLGIMLAWLMEKTGHLYGAFLAHMGANLMSVLHVETNLFTWMDQGGSKFYTATVVMAVISVILIVVIQLTNVKRSVN